MPGAVLARLVKSLDHRNSQERAHSCGNSNEPQNCGTELVKVANPPSVPLFLADKRAWKSDPACECVVAAVAADHDKY